MSLTPSIVPAQEALRNSLDSDAAADAHRTQSHTMPYLFETHDMRVLFAPAISGAWNDNVNLAESGEQQDFIISPAAEIGLNYTGTRQDVLNVDVEIGYDQYLDHDQYSTWFMRSGSGLDYDFWVKDFWINVHDHARYVRGSDQPIEEAEIANTAEFDIFRNLAGFNIARELNKGVVRAGYDHENAISQTAAFDYLDGAKELAFLRGGLQVHPKVMAGLEATGQYSYYDQPVFNDSTGYSIGPYADWQQGTYLRLQARAGFCGYEFQHTSHTMRTSDLRSWYLNVNLSHEATKAVGYSLEAGHEIDLAIEADAAEVWFVRPGIHWDVTKTLRLMGGVAYEHGVQGVGNISGNLTEDFDWCGTEIGARYAIMKDLSVALSYRLTLRSSNAADRSYTQNFLNFALVFTPQLPSR